MKRLFYIDCDIITQTDFELIHRYIRKRLDPSNSNLIIRSCEYTDEMKTLIKRLE